MPLLSWPCLTRDIAPIPGAIKRRYEDFVVDEVPAYRPCGSGEHVYITIEKTGLATMRAVNDVARALGIPPRAIGVAGLKDARGVTRQTISVQGIDPVRIRDLQIPRIRIVAVDRHTNKLRIGHLRGNRFAIRMRETDPARLADVQAVLAVLSRRGAPNYFMQQRFGSRGDTGLIGKALLHADFDTAAALIAGTPGEHDTGEVLKARQLFARGEYEKAAAAWPYGFRESVHVCRVMARGGNARRAIFGIDRKVQGFYVSAFQSMLFNDLLSKRLDRMDVMLKGDLAYKEHHGAVFRVEDAAVEQPRCERFEISPTGPLFGPRMTAPDGEPAAMEQAVLDAAGQSLKDFPATGPFRAAGGRRPLRFRPEEPEVLAGRDEAGAYIELRFTLAAGCYATAVLREVCKDELEEGLAEE